MTLHSPIIITPRLLAGLKVGDALISIEFAPRGRWDEGGRVTYRYYIDLPDGTEHVAEDLRSGVQGGSLQSGLESLLAFLGAAAESFGSTQPGFDEEKRFPFAVCEWAYRHSNELSLLQLELEENKNLITN